ncbi:MULTISPECIES: hypothetical protein [Methanobacterium]|uniref:Uncharacterized protein n=1 Tax=Methanobacterium veterum TaxID=408577 RepID=A0A9E5DH74_9EURY|nr:MULTISPECIES: hypothetical protein [Methanobacterium]MCZ3365396.1 hypothetical protein [Methanobacterium veterum]MCZ3373147.1 hypothetical protein [Methanobacterium veterum]
MSNKRINHLGLLIMSTKELAKSKNMVKYEYDDFEEDKTELKKGNGRKKVQNHFNF